jgi:hypothetical protein
MTNVLQKIKNFNRSLGMVEQSQVVASTAVVVSMVTIISPYFMTHQEFGWLDFVSVVTVGTIGFTSVIFTLKYGRQLEEQRRELQSLNNVAEAVNHSVELNYVLQNALTKVMELMSAECGWIYLVENKTLQLHRQAGTHVKIFPPNSESDSETLMWIREPFLDRADSEQIEPSVTADFKAMGMKMVSSIPLERQGVFAGVVIIGSKEARKFASKKITLLQAFGNQINMALQNASLFEQVKQSEQQYADLYEHSPDMYHTIDRNGIIIRCNYTESLVLGFSKEELIGKPVTRLYAQAHHEKVRENLKKIFEEGMELRGIEEQVQRRDGTPLDVSVNTSIVHDSSAKPAFVRVVLRDITERKKYEAQILQSQKIDSIGNLAGGIAHDFNNILTSILGSASIMRRRSKDDERWSKYVNLIETASRRGASLTRQLLTFARKDNPHIRMIDVNAVIEETLRLIEATTSKSIQIKVTQATEPVIVEADEGQMQQAILNLCLNARDAMPNGGVLYISCKTGAIQNGHVHQIPYAKPGDYVIITVADTGAGIPKQLLPRIFEPFFTTKEQGKGTGLGLSVVYGVIQSHNGYIAVDSEINNGSTFTIYLPRALDSARRTSPQQKGPEIAGGKESILLIEDEISVSEVGADILKDLGYRVTIAGNGKEAMSKLAGNGHMFDLVILDMNMPEMEGRATFELIKQSHPDLRVLICSGYSTKMFEAGDFLKSIDGFLQKPYEIEDLARGVRELLDKDAKA